MQLTVNFEDNCIVKFEDENLHAQYVTLLSAFDTSKYDDKKFMTAACMYIISCLQSENFSMLDITNLLHIPFAATSVVMLLVHYVLSDVFGYEDYDHPDNYEMYERYKYSHGWAKIFFARHKSSGEAVVLKAVPHDAFMSPSTSAITELLTYYQLQKTYGKHPNHGELRSFFVTSNHFWMIMPRYGHTLQATAEWSGIQSNDVRSAFRQVCTAVKNLHDLSIAHRDLKMHNIMVNQAGFCMLIDYGLVSLSSSHSRYTLPVCTITTRSPEMLFQELELKKSQSKVNEMAFDAYKMDIWSLGCIFYSLAGGGRYPFPGKELHQLAEGVERYKKDCSILNSERVVGLLGTDGMDLLHSMLSLSPSDRPSVDTILKHKYFY